MKQQDNNRILESLRGCGLTLKDCRSVFMIHRTRKESEFIKQARTEYVRDGEIEIDDDAEVSVVESDPKKNEAYVQAWVFVRKP
jgi:hypothetical protein